MTPLQEIQQRFTRFSSQVERFMNESGEPYKFHGSEDGDSFVASFPLRRLRFAADAVQRQRLHLVIGVWWHPRGAAHERCVSSMEFDSNGKAPHRKVSGTTYDVAHDGIAVFRELLDDAILATCREGAQTRVDWAAASDGRSAN